MNKFLDRFNEELNQIPIYDVKRPDGVMVKTADVNTICAILTILFDEFDIQKEGDDGK